MTISNEALMAAGKAFYGPVWADIEDNKDHLKYAVDQVRSMLEAAAGIIRADCLEEAIHDLEHEDSVTRKYPLSWLLKRAKAERGDHAGN